MGSCSLHVVHGAFHSGMLKTSWGMDGVLKALHNLFSDSPAQREDFIKLIGTETFPLLFFGHRWLEKKQVAERTLEIWPHITTYIRETQEPSSNIQHFQESELSCTGPPSQGRVGLLCFNSVTDATIPADLPVRCTSASISNQ